MTSSQSYIAPSASVLDEGRRLLQGYVDRSQLAGAVALLAHGDEMIRLECVGQRDIAAGLPMEPDTIFQIASMTKPIVSVAALKLVEAGALSLDDPVSRFLPAFAHTTVFDGLDDDGQIRLVPLEREITIRDLLRHTSGLFGEAPDPALDGTYADLDVYDQPSLEMMRRLAAHPLAHQPGAHWVYGWSHSVLGAVIEVVTDRPLDVYLEGAIFGPLGMVDSGFSVPPEKLARLAVVYDQVDGGLRPSTAPYADVTTPPAFPSGGGGCVSTVLDFWRFVRMLEHGGELDGVRLVAAETVAAMTSNQLDASMIPIEILDQVFVGEGYGLGVGVIVGPGASLPAGAPGTWTWSGSFGTIFAVDPVAELSFILMTQYEPLAWFREGTGYWSIVRGPALD